MIFARFDLAAIRNAARDLFAAWDTAVAAGNAPLAKEIRQKHLWPLVRQSLNCDVVHYPGIYTFVANTTHDGWPSVNYIGQSENNLGDRLEHYVKDDSCWDASLINNSGLIEVVGLARLRPVMPSTEETLRKHLAKHAATIRKARGCSLFVAGFDSEEAQFILPTEAALIALAWSNGAKLENDRVQRLPSPDRRPRVLAFCKQIFAGWRGWGLNEKLWYEASEALERASR